MSSTGQTDSTYIDSIYNDLMHMQRDIKLNTCKQDLKDIEQTLKMLDTILLELQELYAKEENPEL